MVVVDTNVLTGLFIDGPFSDAARTLYAQDADWRSEPLILIEFTSLLMTQIRAGRLTASAAPVLLDRARAVFDDTLHAVDHVDALTLAARLAISAYDARFLQVAQTLGAPLVTEDAALRRRAPDDTWSMADALAA